MFKIAKLVPSNRLLQHTLVVRSDGMRSGPQLRPRASENGVGEYKLTVAKHIVERSDP